MSGQRLDLVLIHPNGREAYPGLGELPALEPPLWCAMLASYVRKKGHSVVILDAELTDASPKDVAKEVNTLTPRVACVVAYGHHPSASTQVMPAAGATVRAIGKLCGSRVHTLLLGGHVAALPEKTLIEEGAKFVCSGEGFITLHELLKALKPGSDFNAIFQDVRGLVLSQGTPQDEARKPWRTAPAPLVKDLDGEVGIPAWDLLPPFDKYRAHNWHAFGRDRAPYASIYTTLGCPYSCSFCCIQAPFKEGEREHADLYGTVGGKPWDAANSYRRWSPGVVGDALQQLSRSGVRNIKIADEMFVLNRAHVDGVCEEILRRKLDLNLWAYARTDTVRDGLLPKLKAAGFRWLALGIESGAASVRAGVDKELSEEGIRETVAKIQEAGIYVIGNFIFGLPGDTPESMERTIALAQGLNCEFANFYVAMAYPGSALYQKALEVWPEGLPATWSGYAQYGKDSKPLATEALTAAEIVAFRDRAFERYFTSPAYLSMLLRTFGPEAVDEVKRMTRIPLDRRSAAP